MNAKQVEQLTGISKRNLRFYEEKRLICPGRNPKNDYREYSETEVETLKLIRVLRMLDVPLEEVKLCIDGNLALDEIGKIQEKRLKEKQKKISVAIGFCQRLGRIPWTAFCRKWISRKIKSSYSGNGRGITQRLIQRNS